MRRILVIAALCLLAAASLSAQTSERIEVSVVNVDVSVTGSDGQPIHGLTTGDFEVFEDGRKQPITNFYVVSGAQKPSPETGTVSQSAPPGDQFRKRVLVLVDVFRTSKNRRAVALASLERMIDDSFHTGEYDWSIAILGRGVTMVLPLTTDKKAIHATLAAMLAIGERKVPSLFAQNSPQATDALPSPSDPGQVRLPATTERDIERALGFEEEDQVLRAQFTTRAIVDAVRGFASTSGKKIVLLLTGDLGLNDLAVSFDNFNARGGALMQRPMGPDFADRQRQLTEMRSAIIREANASGVAMYISNVEGLDPAGDIGIAQTQMTNTSAAFWLSKETGGRLLTGNDLRLQVRQFDAASSNYYSLGYRSPHPDDGKYHHIEVRLKNVKAARLDYRSGYSSGPADVELARAMQSSIAATLLPDSVPVTLESGSPHSDARGIAVPITVHVPFSSLQFLPSDKGVSATIRIFVSVFDDTGKKLTAVSSEVPIQLAAPDPQRALAYKNEVVINRGVQGRIVAAVQDETTGNTGVAEINLPKT